MISYISALVILVLVLIGLSMGPEATGISMNYFDSILHLVTGSGLGFFVLGLAESFSARKWKRFWPVVGMVFIAGIIWEIYEGYFGITGYDLWTKMYYLDTIKDLILDVVGAGLVAHIMIRRH